MWYHGAAGEIVTEPPPWEIWSTENKNGRGQPCFPVALSPRISLFSVREWILSQKRSAYWHSSLVWFWKELWSQRPMWAGSMFPTIFWDEITWILAWSIKNPPCTQACSFGMTPDGPTAHLTSTRSMCLWWTAAGPWHGQAMFSCLDYVRILTQKGLNSAVVSPGLQTPKLEGMGKKEKARNQICLKLNWPIEITTKNPEHSLLDTAALICANKKIKRY